MINLYVIFFDVKMWGGEIYNPNQPTFSTYHYRLKIFIVDFNVPWIHSVYSRYEGSPLQSVQPDDT